MSVMSDNELRCFQAAQKWQRIELLDWFANILKPKLPFIDQARRSSLVVKLLYTAVILALVPLLTLAFIIRTLAVMLIFPWRYWRTRITPHDLQAPGERNIQGIHHAFSRYINLSAENYIQCVNEWIAILYGDAALEHYRMETFVNLERLEQTAASSKVSPTQLRNTLSMARETLSRKLGYYR